MTQKKTMQKIKFLIQKLLKNCKENKVNEVRKEYL